MAPADFVSPMRNPDTLSRHGYAGGAQMTMIGNEEEDDLDAEGEIAPGDESDADSLLDPRPAKRQERRRSSGADDDEAEARRRRKDKEREKDRRPGKKPVEVEDDDDEDD